MNAQFRWRGFCLHPNGFYLTLLGAVRGCRIRVHYWPPNTKKLDTPHDHRSWFVSLPVWGVLDERRYEEVEAVDLEVHACHATARRGSLTNKVGLGGVREVARKLRLPLVPYLCRVGVIHSLVPKTKRALTLVVFGPDRVTPRAWLKRGEHGQ